MNRAYKKHHHVAGFRPLRDDEQDYLDFLPLEQCPRLILLFLDL